MSWDIIWRRFEFDARDFPIADDSRHQGDQVPYTYVEYSPRYRREILDLQRLLWSPDTAVNDAYLAWKYERNPYLENPIVALALHEGLVVGMRGAWGARWHLGAEAEPTVVPCAGDTVIAIAHRGRGLLYGLNRLLLQMLDRAGFPTILSLSAGPQVFHGSIKDGWRPLLEYGEWMRAPPLLKHRWPRKLRDRLLLPALPERLLQFGTNCRMRLRRSKDRSGVAVDDTPRIRAMADLIRENAPRAAIGQVRDEQYISWRYECPLSRYRFLNSGVESLDGFMVLQQRRDHRYGTNIVDWEVTSPAVFDKLLAAAIRVTGVGELKLWSVSVPESLRPVLQQHGFEISGPGPENGYRRSIMVKETGAARQSRTSGPLPGQLADDGSCKLRMIFSDDH